MDREQQARELQAWIERYVREEVEREIIRQSEDILEESETLFFLPLWDETTDADGFTADDRAFLAEMKISTEVIQ